MGASRTCRARQQTQGVEDRKDYAIARALPLEVQKPIMALREALQSLVL